MQEGPETFKLVANKTDFSIYIFSSLQSIQEMKQFSHNPSNLKPKKFSSRLLITIQDFFHCPTLIMSKKIQEV